jgi:hypothetical protein
MPPGIPTAAHAGHTHLQGWPSGRSEGSPTKGSPAAGSVLAQRRSLRQRPTTHLPQLTIYDATRLLGLGIILRP